jgi:hypothetical protein
MILDDKGRIIYYKDVSGSSTGDFKLHSNGLMSYSARGKFYLMDSTFTTIDSVASVNGIMADLHDLQILPNGHCLLLGMENVQRNLSSYYMFLGNGSPGSSNATVKAGVVQELNMNKQVVFEWHSIDYFDFDDVDEYFLNNPASVDWTHMNAVEQDDDGNILISSRHFNEITKISRSDSSIIWRLGGKRNQFTFINDSLMFLSQHDCRRLPNGNLSLFDNGRMMNPLHAASAKEYALDEINMTADLVWSYTESPSLYSRSQGNVQRLANGNTLINYGDFRNSDIVFNVVDSSGARVFEISFPDTLISYRSFNFPSLPWNLPRPRISCYEVSGQLFLQADSVYSAYLWSGGESTRSIAVNDTGMFQVFVPFGDNSFLGSEIFYVSDLSNACLISSIEHPGSEQSIPLFPNPATDRLVLHLPSGADPGDLPGFYNLTGERIALTCTTLEENSLLADISILSPGIYFVLAGKYRGRFVKQ